MARPARIYLDHNATAPLRPCAREAMLAALTDDLGNPSSPHAEGRAAARLLDTARRQVAALAGRGPEHVIFTSGGTEAVNAMVHAAVRAAAADGPRRIIATTTDHACVLESLEGLRSLGWEASLVPVDRAGRVDLHCFSRLLEEGAAGAVAQWANNETGVIQDVARMGALCEEAGVPLLLDAVQAAGKLPLAGDGAPDATLALSAHKLGGPAGVGAVVLNSRLAWAPLLRGGHQEQDRRAGTEPVLAAVGFGAAAAEAATELPKYAAVVGPRRDALVAGMRAHAPALIEHGADALRVANTANVRVPGWRADTLVQRLDLEGVAAGTGAACAAGAAEPSHVLQAMGLSAAHAAEAVRFSLGYATSDADVARAVDAVGRVAAAWGGV